jgi:hypothetical protein
MAAEAVPGPQEPLSQLHVDPPLIEQLPEPLRRPSFLDIETHCHNPHVGNKGAYAVEGKIEHSPVQPEPAEEIKARLHHRRPPGYLPQRIVLMRERCPDQVNHLGRQGGIAAHKAQIGQPHKPLKVCPPVAPPGGNPLAPLRKAAAPR